MPPRISSIRIKLQSYDHSLVDRTAERIVKTVKNVGATVKGPIPLPTRIRRFTVLRSPHVNKDSREQFEIRVHKRIIDIYPKSAQETVEALRKLEIPSSVDIVVKVK
ncbi:MAG: 30S ribosomal protein S10 [Chlorobi bacterium]|nr:30S ribosomal protein S10 [Chlorobiota bacterium]